MTITRDLLPKNVHTQFLSDIGSSNYRETRADLLQKAIQAMSLEKEEQLTLPDSPRFRAIDETQLCLMGRLPNPDCQPFSRMIEFMPVYANCLDSVWQSAWHSFISGPVPVCVSKGKDLLTVLMNRPWSYNHWTMILERWILTPTYDFLKSMDIWIQIHHIPAIFFKEETMHKLASEVEKVENIEY